MNGNNEMLVVGRVVRVFEGKANVVVTMVIPHPTAEDKSKADFLDVRVWGTAANFVKEYVNKGDTVMARCSVRNNSYEKQDGTKVYEVAVNCNHFDKLSWSDKADNEESPF
jgi:single-stranded DNA-binding protein